MKLTIKNFCDSVNSICKNPQMYTLNGTFGEAIAMIEYSAKASNLFNVASHHGLHPFQKWLAKDSRFANSIDFTCFYQFRENFKDDTTALEEFAKLFTKFCRTLPNEEDEIDIRLKESDALNIFSLLLEVLNNESISISKTRKILCS